MISRRWRLRLLTAGHDLWVGGFFCLWIPHAKAVDMRIIQQLFEESISGIIPLMPSVYAMVPSRV